MQRKIILLSLLWSISMWSISMAEAAEFIPDKNHILHPNKVRRGEAYDNSYNHAHMSKLYNEVLDNFTLYGEPVSPLALSSMVGWQSDLLPSVRAIDLNATVGSNQYYGNVYEIKNSFITYSATGEDTHQPASESYFVIGKLSNNMLVVRLESSGGGSGIFVNLIVLKIDLTPVWDLDQQGFEQSNFGLKQRYLINARSVFVHPMQHTSKFLLQNNILTINEKDKIDFTPLIEKTKSH